MNIENLTGTQVLLGIIGVLLLFFAILVFKLRNYIFKCCRGSDLYPVKYYRHGKSKKIKAKGSKDIVPAKPDLYEQIINDYPTLHRQSRLIK